MPTQNNPKQLELNIDPVCKMCGCRQQDHFRTIRKLQEIIGGLEIRLSEYEKKEKRQMHHAACTRIFGECNCDEIDKARSDANK